MGEFSTELRRFLLNRAKWRSARAIKLRKLWQLR
jgi:hypothetical protein